MDYSQRIQSLKRSMASKKLDAILIAQPENRRYLSGYSGGDHGIGESAGVLLICRKSSPFLLTDFRFREQAENETEGYEVQLYHQGLFALLGQLLPKLGVTRLGFESGYTLHSAALQLEKTCLAKGIEIVGTQDVIETMRCIKSEEEIDLIRKSVRLNEAVFQKVYSHLTGNETELDIALLLAQTMRTLGAEGESFATIVANGASSSLPHAVPTRRKIDRNQPLLIDMGLVLDGYCSDMTRTFILGSPDPRYLEIHRIVRRAQLAGIAAVHAGATGKEVDTAARRIIDDAGYGDCFGHALGHGVGLAVHEEPRVSQRNRKQLKNGMVITIEPGIYIPGWGGIRLENMVVVREGGCEVLNEDTTYLDI